MKILVTGGAGFIGSHVVDALLGLGHDVHILDDLSGGVRANVPAEAVLHELDIRSEAARDLFAAHQYEVMYHLAAQMDVRRSVADPMYDADVNVRGFLNLLEGGRANGLKKVVFSSTGGAIYGEPDFVPQTESHPLQPISPYGITKLVSEKYLHYYFVQYGLSYVALRYGNVYGPRQNPHGEAGVVAIFCERLINGDACTIYGDGTQTRDYVFVGDVVKANVSALSVHENGIFNVGTGVETDVNTLFEHLRDRLSPTSSASHAPGRPGEQRRSVLSFEKSAQALGWRPSVSVKDGLYETADWFKDRSTAA